MDQRPCSLETSGPMRWIAKAICCSNACLRDRAGFHVTVPFPLARLLAYATFGVLGALLVVGTVVTQDADQASSNRLGSAIEWQEPAKDVPVLASLHGSRPSGAAMVHGTLYPVGTFEADTDSCGDDADPDDCCATTCHSAITDLGPGVLIQSKTTDVGLVACSSILKGRPQEPGDRPPRAA